MTKKLFLIMNLMAFPALAGGPVVDGAEARRSGDTWTISVTVSHGDTGWDHYADGWRVESLDGTELGYRKLLHPHVNEQPFTRSLGGVMVPDGSKEVVIRAHDSVHGWGEGVTLTMPE